MESAIETFVEFWSRLGLSSGPYIHPEDNDVLEDVGRGDFDLSLLPKPVSGNLRQAKIVILMLNPGLDQEDHEWEARVEFRDALVKNITQTHGPDGYPFQYLNPLFRQHPGAGYWTCARTPSGTRRDQQKLRRVIQAISDRDGVPFGIAQMHLSRSLAVIQLCPYHSVTMRHRKLLERLPSSQRARSLVRELIASDDKVIIAIRSVAEWNLQSPESDRLIIYPGKLARAASLSPESEGGRNMIHHVSRIDPMYEQR